MRFRAGLLVPLQDDARVRFGGAAGTAARCRCKMLLQGAAVRAQGAAAGW